ncbi:MAG: high-potential iron-sulfur protein [Nevskiales bacterium]|jgi:hypothetical protein
MSHPVSSDRRRFLSRIALGAAALPLLRLTSAQAADLPHLSPDDPTAKALGYTLDASKIDPKKETAFKAGSHCGGCALFTAPASGDFGACGAFSGKAVNKGGWCRAYAAMM